MPDQSYRNRELDDKFKNICDLISESKTDLSKSLTRIEEQTLKTNGRVNRLEGWRQWLTGGMAIASLIIVPIFGWVIYQVSHQDEAIRAAVAEALLPYAK